MSTWFIVAVVSLAVLCQVEGQKGLTFVKEDHLTTFYIDRISCRNWADPNGMNCDAYAGDTLCTVRLPVLCAKINNSPRPAYLVFPSGGVMPAAFYAGWNRGTIANTPPVQGSQFVNRAAVDAFCVRTFGAGWQVAEFHDGTYILGMNGTNYAGDSWTQNAARQNHGGWSFYSLGNVRNNTRFWIHITDQPSTCWTQ